MPDFDDVALGVAITGALICVPYVAIAFATGNADAVLVATLWTLGGLIAAGALVWGVARAWERARQDRLSREWESRREQEDGH